MDEVKVKAKDERDGILLRPPAKMARDIRIMSAAEGMSMNRFILMLIEQELERRAAKLFIAR